MSHLPILPIVIAAFGGFVLTFLGTAAAGLQRLLGGLLIGLNLIVGVAGIGAVAGGEPLVYALGDWPAPFGIILVLDRLSALMVLLTAVVAAFAFLAAVGGWDRRGRMFHALLQFQLMGLYGAFLTGDIFNLFVFFEILLIASYGLLLHGRGAPRARAAIKYVVVNLTGSALFLIAVGALYGATGTLNMADLALRIPELTAAERPLAMASALLFLVVFGTKAALVPLFFWLPDAYARASAPVAALFAVMTKVGVYAIVRLYTLAFDAPLADIGALAAPWLEGAAALTLVLGALGALQAESLGRLAGYLNIASIGTMLLAIAQFTGSGLSAGLFYMINSTLAVAALFLLVEPVRVLRGEHGDRLAAGPALASWAPLGLLFLGVAVAMAGLPPLGGFLGKALILAASLEHERTVLAWILILTSSLLSVVALSRAASVLFWKSGESDQPATPGLVGVRDHMLPALGLVAAMIAFTALAGPVSRYTDAVAAEALAPGAYIEAVLSNRTVVTAEGR